MAPLLFLSSCGKGSKNQVVELNDLEFTYEGPLYEGANTAQYAWKVDLKSLLKDQYTEGMQIKGATLLKADISDEGCEECYGFEEIKSLVLSFASNKKDIPMQEVALLNPIDAKAPTQALKISQEIDLKDFLNAGEVYIVLDAVISEEEIDDNITLKGNLQLDLNFD